MSNKATDILDEMYGCEDLKPIDSKRLKKLKELESKALIDSLNNLDKKFTQWW